MKEEIKGDHGQSSAGKEVELFDLVKSLWIGRKTILKCTILFMFIGLFLAIFSQREYISSTTIMPSNQNEGVGGDIGGLAAMAGINLGGMGNQSNIPPSLYPKIISSINFQKELLLTPLFFDGQKSSITYKDYYTNYHSLGLLGNFKKYTIGLPGLIVKKIKGKTKPSILFNKEKEFNLQMITEEESILIKRLTKQLSLNVNKKGGYVDLSFNMPEAIPSAQMAQQAQKLLQHYIINFKTQKSSEQLKFIKERYIEKEKEFKKIQEQYARFQDENQSVNSALSKMNLMRLQSDYDVAYTVYSELAKQMETQQFKVKENTPVFTILKPVTVPVEKSKPNRPLILIILTLLGSLAGIGVVFGKPFVVRIKKKW